MTPAIFNLGDALYKQKRYEEAGKQYNDILSLSKNKKQQSMTYHNLGNSYLEHYHAENNQQKKEQSLNEAIESYKNSLKKNPRDPDTKYNLSYAMQLKKMLEQQKKNQQKQQNKNNKDQDKKDQQKKQDQQKNQQQKQNNPQKKELSKEEANKLLQAIQEQEKDVNKKMNTKQAVPLKAKIEKQW